MKCPKCGYQRTKQDDDLISKSECPSCGIIYEKFKGAKSNQTTVKQQKEGATNRQSHPTTKNVVPEQTISKPFKAKNKIFIIMSWILGLFFVLAGVSSIAIYPLSSILLLLIAFLILPPVRKFVGNKTKITISLPIRIIAIVILMVVSGNISINQNVKRMAREAGFTTVAAYNEAQRVGFSTKEKYQAYLIEEKTKKIEALEKKLSATTGFLPQIKILEKLSSIDPKTYNSQLSEMKEKYKHHEEKIEKNRTIAEKRRKEEELRKEKERQEQIIGVWHDTRPYWNAEYILTKREDVGKTAGELIIKFGDGTEQRSLGYFDKDYDNNLIFTRNGNNHRGEYFIVMNGLLQSFDNQGLIVILLPGSANLAR